MTFIVVIETVVGMGEISDTLAFQPFGFLFHLLLNVVILLCPNQCCRSEDAFYILKITEAGVRS